MPLSNVTRRLDEYFSPSALPNLRTYFGTVRKGNPHIYDTPFAKGESTSELLKAWMSELVSIADTWPTLWKFENDLAKKVGPMSYMLPLKDRITDIKHYYEDILLPSKLIPAKAIDAVISEWGTYRGVRHRSQGKVVDLMKKSTNSGAPFFTKRRNVVDKSYPVYINKHEFFLMEVGPTQVDSNWIKYEEPKYWNSYPVAVLGWRGQEGGPKVSDVKQRVIWMFPFSLNIDELTVYQPLIEAAQKFNWCPAWVSMDAVDERITKLFDTKSSDDLIVCTDFSRFDQHFNYSMQDCARDILQGILTWDSPNKYWIDSVFPAKYEIPMMYNYGHIVTGAHGMASGSGGTNADETLAHRALQYEAAFQRKVPLNPNSQCLGDDGILSYPGITVEDVVRCYSSHGQEMNLSKQYASTQDCVYLRRWHHKDYRVDGVCAGVYSTCRALGRLRYLERFQDPEYWDAEMVALRQLSILENVKNHPMKDQFAEFCMKRDKYRLGLDIPGFLDGLVEIARRAIDHMPDFMGYTKTLQSQDDPTYGIEGWWIVNFLKSKA